MNQGANVLKHGLLVFIEERIFPAGHGCAGLAVSNGPEQFRIRLGGGGGGNEIPRTWRQKRSLGAVALAGGAMAIHTMFTIECLAARQAVSGLGEQGGGAATDRHDDE